MKRPPLDLDPSVYALAVGAVVYLVAGIILLILGTNIFASPLTIQSALVVVAGMVAAAYAFWRLLSNR